MFGLAPSATKEGAPRMAIRAMGAKRASQPSTGVRRRGAECPELIVKVYNYISISIC